MLNKKDKLLAAAQKFLERGSLDKALVEFQRAAQEDAKDTRTWLRIAEIHVKRGEAAQATDVYLKTAELYVEQGFFQRAAAVYKNVLKLTPGHAMAHTKLAEVYRQLGLLSDSAQQFEQAATSLARGGKPKEAMAALGQIIEMNPDQVMVRVKMAEIAAQATLNEDAIREFNRAAEQLEAQGRVDDFLRVAERILQLDPKDTALGKRAAARYMERGNPKAALAKLQACFNIDAKDTETLQLLANSFLELGQTAKTVTVLKELAQVQDERRQQGERAATLQRIRALDPNDPLVADLDMPRPKRPGPATTPARTQTGAQPIYAPEPQFEPATPPALLTAERRPARREPTITFSELAVPPILAREPSQPILTPGETALPSLDDEQIAAEVARILAETETFVKYGLTERAAEHVRKVFDLSPEHELAQERLIAILVQLGRTAEAVEELGILADRRSLSDPEGAIRLLRRALELDPNAVGAKHMLERLTAQEEVEDDSDVLELDELELEPIGEPEAEAPAAVIDDEPAEREWSTAGQTQIDPGVVGAMQSAVSASAEAPPLLDELEIEFDIGPSMIKEAPLDPAVAGELEQVDFFLEQGLPEEARALLDEIAHAHPESARHPEVEVRRNRLDQMSELEDERTRMKPDSPRGPGPAAERGATPRSPAGPERTGDIATPRTIIAVGADPTTLRDLAIAYKEMGLNQAAIAELNKLVDDPEHQIFALMMIGECYEAEGAFAEALLHYKKALNRPTVRDDEATRLYYLLGRAFEALGDKGEALYFFEKVVKREHEFDDVAGRVERLRRSGVAPIDHTGDDLRRRAGNGPRGSR